MSIERAWEQFHAGEEPRDVRGAVLSSWRRSQISGVDPEHVEVPHVDTDPDSHLARVAVPILERTAELLGGDKTCLALADARGGVVWRWVSEPMLRNTLDELSVAQGFCFDEEFAGTNGLGTALETGSLAVVRGSEHFVHRFHRVTCVAAPVRHPVTRRTIGAVNITCQAEHTNSLLPVVVMKVVDEVHAALLREAGGRERRLLQAFLDAQRGTAGPVLAVSDDLVIANRAATDLDLDLDEIRDEVGTLRGPASPRQVDLPADLSARVDVVREGSAIRGVVLAVTGSAVDPGHRRPAATPSPPDRWDQLLGQATAAVDRGPVAVCGEAGTGKATLLAAVLPGAAVLDAATLVAEGPRRWASRVAARLDEPEVPLVLLHAELLPIEAQRAVAALVDERPRRAALAITVTAPDGRRPTAPPDLLVDELGAEMLTVPPLRRRPDDVVGLALQELQRHGPGRRLALDAQTALRRYDWPGNTRELVRVVRRAAQDASGTVVGLDVLPAEVRAAAGRRVLNPLERAESAVIATVLQECRGNKSAAAKQLGISRTALYAKLRSYRL